MCDCDESGIPDQWWSKFQNMLSISHMLVTVELPTAQQSFTITAMTSQWHDFLHTDCGFDKPDPELVARLTAKHAEIFQEMLHENGVEWDGLGVFISLTKDWTALKVSLSDDESSAAVGSMFTWMWKDAFDLVSLEHYEPIETALWEEQGHKLI